LSRPKGMFHSSWTIWIILTSLNCGGISNSITWDNFTGNHACPTSLGPRGEPHAYNSRSMMSYIIISIQMRSF
jgi:hypothetical protein